MEKGRQGMKFAWRLICMSMMSLTLLLAAGSASAYGAWAPGDLRSVGLRLSDLPPQTIPDTARFWTKAQAAGRDRLPTSTYNRHGRVLSYEDSFTRNVITGSEPVWLLLARSEITAFNTVAGARWYFHRLNAEMPKEYVMSTNNLGANAGQTAIKVPFRRLAIPAVGVADAGFTADSGGDEMAYTTRVILFERGRYVVELHIRGLQDQTLVSSVVGVARKIDARVKAVSPGIFKS